jgi:hypothetical protein
MSASDVSAEEMARSAAYRQTSSIGLVYHRELRLLVTSDVEPINRIFSS